MLNNLLYLNYELSASVLLFYPGFLVSVGIGIIVFRALVIYKRTQMQAFFNPVQSSLINTLVVNRSMIRFFSFGLFLYFISVNLWVNSFFLSSGLLISTPSITLLHCILLLLGILVFILNRTYFRVDKIIVFEYPILLAFSVLLLMVLSMSFDLFLMFILFEFITMIFVILIGGVSTFSRNALYAAFFYFLSNVIVGGIFLFSLFLGIIGGMSTLFSIAITPGLFNFLVMAALLGISVLFLFKLSCVPFQWWTPFVYERGPLPILFILATGSKVVAAFLFFKLLQLVFFEYSLIWQHLILLSSVLSMVVGSFGLLSQVSLKRFWGYSTINHMGFLLLGLVANNPLGWRGFFIYLGAYLILNIIFFFLLSCIVKARNNTRLIMISELSLIPNFAVSLLGACFGLLMLASIGIPPFLTFWGKYVLISSYILSETNSFILYFILFVIVVTSVVAAFAYLRVWKTIYAEDILPSNKIIVYPIATDGAAIIAYFILFQALGGLFVGLFLTRFYSILDNMLFLFLFC